MLATMGLTPQQALVCTMVLVGFADGEMSDREIGVMTAAVQTVPAFAGMTQAELTRAMDATISFLNREDGLQRAATLIGDALCPKLRETAYLLACDVVAIDQFAIEEEIEMLAFLADTFRMNPQTVQALELAARVRCRIIDKED